MAAITTGEILFKYSVVTASAGNTTASSAAASLGDQISVTPWAGGVANDLFDDISGAENAASTVDYRCIFVHNSNASNTLENAVVYMSDVAGGASIALAADSTAASVIASASAQALTVANETTAPAGPLTFSSPTTAGAGVSLGNIPSGQCKAFWVRRTAANSAALSADGCSIFVAGDTGSL